MDEIEKALMNQKQAFDKIQAPPELEASLRTALANRRVKPLRTKGIAAAALFLVLFFTYSYDAIAYYGKQLLGYDQVISGSLKDLNKLGHGQDIGKAFTFSDGTEINIDKIFFDDNELVALYTETKGATDGEMNFGSDVQIELQGLFGAYPAKGGRGRMDKKNMRISWVKSFAPPLGFEKWLSFVITKNVNGKMENGRISFVLDRNKAINYSLKHDIVQTVKVDGRIIKFNSLVATPLSTLIKGNIENFGRGEHLTFDLIADGKKIPYESGGSNGGEFELAFDGIKKVSHLEISNIKIIKERMLNQTIPISANSKDIQIGEGDELYLIKDVSARNGNTYLNIERKADIEAVLGIFDSDKQLSEIKEEKDESQKGDMIKELRIFKGTADNIRIKFLQTNIDYKGQLDID